MSPETLKVLMECATVGGFIGQLLSTGWLTAIIKRELRPVIRRIERVERELGIVPELEPAGA